VSKSDDHDDIDAGMTTAEKRRRKRRNSGLRVPSDNVPRRGAAVVAPVPEDPSLAVSIAYSFANDASEPLRMDELEPTFEPTRPNFEVRSTQPGIDSNGFEPLAPDLAATLTEMPVAIDDPGFEVKTREMLAVDLDALGLREPSTAEPGPAELADLVTAPERLTAAISEPIPQSDDHPGRSVSAGWSQPMQSQSVQPLTTAAPMSQTMTVIPGAAAESADDYESFETATAERPVYRDGVAPTRSSTVILADADLDDLVEDIAATNATVRASRDSMEISVDFDERSSPHGVALRDRPSSTPAISRAPTEPPSRPSARALVPPVPQPEVVAESRSRPTSTPPLPPVVPASVPIVPPPPAVSSVATASGPPPPPHAAKAPPSPPPKVEKTAEKSDSKDAKEHGKDSKDRESKESKDKRAAKSAKAKTWFTDVFDEDYLKTLPFLTPQSTQAEAEFVLAAMDLAPGAQLLDIGCGYGRHAMELAARGFHVVGLDLSLPLLVRGGEEAHRRGLTINFVRGDMRELDFDNQFDGAYCLFSTFGYFDDDTNKKTALNIARALRPGGKLVLEILNRDYIVADLPTRVWWEGEGCVILEEIDFNYFFSRVVINRSLVMDDGRQLEQEISMRAYSLHEIGRVLHGAGFRVLEISGGYQTRGRFFGNQSRHIVIVAEKKAE
jgi:SAM-dependent methyltransferase